MGDWTASQSCATGFVDVIENSIVLTGPDGGGCGGANWVKIETTIPEGTFSVSFDWSYWTYDGWVYDPPQYGVNGVYTLLTQQNQDSGTKTVTVTAGDIFTFRQYSIDSCCQAGHLTISNLSLWEFTTTSTALTTTTSTTALSTTVLATNPTTTTVPETTSTSSTSTTTSTTSTSTTTTTTSTTTTTVPAPVETYAPVEPEPDETSTTEPPVEETTTTVTLPEETVTTDEPSPETYPETTTTIEPDLEPLAEEEVQALVAEATTIEELQEIFEELTPEQVEQVVEEILNQEELPTQEQAVALATSPEVLSVISVDNAEKVFEALQVEELTEEQVSELIEAVQFAPEEIRTQFETSVDIFASDLGDYVPVGSSVPVDTRRTLIAVAAGAAMATVGARKNP